MYDLQTACLNALNSKHIKYTFQNDEKTGGVLVIRVPFNVVLPDDSTDNIEIVIIVHSDDYYISTCFRNISIPTDKIKTIAEFVARVNHSVESTYVMLNIDFDNMWIEVNGKNSFGDIFSDEYVSEYFLESFKETIKMYRHAVLPLFKIINYWMDAKPAFDEFDEIAMKDLINEAES